MAQSTEEMTDSVMLARNEPMVMASSVVDNKNAEASSSSSSSSSS